MRPGSRSRALVACIGNSLAGDDAVGCEVFERLTHQALPEGTRLRLLGLNGFSVLDSLSGEDVLIVVDAVQFGSPPGSLHVLDWDALPRAAGAAVSVHGLGLRDAIAVGRRLYPEDMPKTVLLVGIEGRRFDEIGASLDPEVAVAVDRAAHEVMTLLVSLVGTGVAVARHPADEAETRFDEREWHVETRAGADRGSGLGAVIP